MAAAAQVLLSLIPIVAIVIVGILSFFALQWDNRKRLLIIEKGGRPAPRSIDDKLLLIGIVALFVGIGLTVFFSVHNGLSNSLLGGIVPMMVGLGVITSYAVIWRTKK